MQQTFFHREMVRLNAPEAPTENRVRGFQGRARIRQNVPSLNSPKIEKLPQAMNRADSFARVFLFFT
jgi:hypothetical protein